MVEDYNFGRIVIDGKTYRSDCIIYPDRVDTSWWRRDAHSLCMDDVKQALEESPEVLVIGCGAMNCMRIPEEFLREFDRLDVELIAQPTPEACKTYNYLTEQGKKTIAALHLTC